MRRALVATTCASLAALVHLAAAPARAQAEPTRAEPAPLRRITHHLIELIDAEHVAPPLKKAAPLACLGDSVHAPWQNPFTPLPAPLAARHVRMTLAAAEATVEYRDAFLVEAPRTLAFDVTPLERARLELGYRLFSCDGGKGDVDLHVRVRDASGVWETTTRLEFDRPKRRSRDAFREVVVDLPIEAGSLARVELELAPVKDSGAGVLVALAEPVLSGVAPGPAVDADTNVLWIVIDSVRSDALGPSRAFGPSPTPVMDARIFARGTGFTQAYAMSNQTRTSTMAMIASLPPSIGGFHSNSWAFTSGRRETFYAQDPPLVTRELMSAGFRVAHFGHNHFLWNSEIIGLDNGFPRVVDFRGIPSDAVNASEEAIALFERRRDERWFLMLNYTAPHTPYRAPEAFAEAAVEAPFAALPGRVLPEVSSRRDDAADARGGEPTGSDPAKKHRRRRRERDADDKARADEAPSLKGRVGFLPRSYLGELMWVDHNLTAVFAKLDELGLLERTLVIVTADHGEVMNPAHDCYSAAVSLGCGFNHSVTVYDDELNVPLGMALPGRITPGRTLETPVSHADLPPTILDLLGLPIPSAQVGRSLRSALAGGALGEAPIYADGRFASALRIGDWKLIVHAPQDDITPRARMVDGEAPKHELFDLAADPLETTNLALAKKDVVQLMLGELKALRLDLRARFERRASLGGDAPLASGPAGAVVDADTRATNHLMLVSDGAPHALEGRISVAHGTIRCPTSASPSPALACTQDGERAVVIAMATAKDAALATSREADPASLALELVTSPWSAPITTELALDGRALPADRLRLGPFGLALLPRGAGLDTTSHLALAVSALAPLPQPNEAAVYFWRSAFAPASAPHHDGAPLVSQPASPEDGAADPHADEQLGGEVRKILQGLGYTH